MGRRKFDFVETSSKWTARAALPLFAFVAVSAFFAGRQMIAVGVALVGLLGFLRLQDHRRRKREELARQRTANEQCSDCGYDLRNSDYQCPECGRAIPSAILKRRENRP